MVQCVTLMYGRGELGRDGYYININNILFQFLVFRSRVLIFSVFLNGKR